MSLPRPSGLKQPSRIGRPSALPTVRPQTPTAGNPAAYQHPQNATPSLVTKAHSAIAKSARGVGFCSQHADRYAYETSRALPGPEPQQDGDSTDDFKIGDRIWVSGNKPGVIAFIGETQFAPGDWAGIVLDEPIGKNDGTVMGIRYFQCEAKRGVFSRLSKLSHTQQSPSQGQQSPTSESKLSDLRSNNSAITTATANGISGPTNLSSRPPSRLGLTTSKNLSTSSSSLHKCSSAGATPTGIGAVGVTPLRLPGTMPGGVRVGDRVLVSGSKSGILRYIGETDFAKGVWAGVELDEPQGKNDGAVAGKRYFDCKPLHGLFAPVHKISRAGSLTSTPSPHSRPLMSTSLRSSREHSGSQESMLSLSSTASSVSRSRGSKTGHRPSTLNLSATTAALQKALKEKEEHIEQLLRERDLERSEVARAAAHVDEAEGQLSSMRTEQDRLRLDAEEQISRFSKMVVDLENQKQELNALLEEEKRKVEDLQFQLEEETLKDEDDVKENSVSELQLKELERQANKEKERSEKLEKDFNDLKQKLEDQMKVSNEAQSVQTSYLDQIEELTYKLTQAESRIKTFESARLEDGAKTSQVSIELAEKHNRVKDLEEQLALQHKEMSLMSQQLNDVREELIASNEKRKKQEEYIQEFVNKLKQCEDENKNLIDQLHSAVSGSADLQRQLTESNARAEELASDRNKLELRLSELMKNSGDSSSQLAAINDQLMERSRRIQDLQNDLSKCSQSQARAEESCQKLKQEKDREILETTKNYEEKISKLAQEISELNSAVEKYKARATQLSEHLEIEKTKALEQKEAEVKELQRQREQANSDLNKHKEAVTALKQLVETVTSEKEALQHEKQQAEKQLSRADDDKLAISTALVQSKGELTTYQEEVEKLKGSKSELEGRVEKLTLQVEYTAKAKQEAENSRDELKAESLQVAKGKDMLQQELAAVRMEVQRKNDFIEEIQKESHKLQEEASRKAEELMSKSQTETDYLNHELHSLKLLLKATEDQLESKEFQIAELQSEVEQNVTLVNEKDVLVSEKSELVKEKEQAEEKCRSLIQTIKVQSDKAAEAESEMQALKSSEAALRREKLSLETKIGQLQSDLEKAKREAAEAAVFKEAAESSSQSGNVVYSQLKEEAVFAKGQVDFLNSVIVELQTKNQELLHRLSVMEDSGIHTNGEFTEALETPTHSRAPPRLFCDICDVFDLHDTEDCPKQAMSNSPEPSRHHGDPKNTRPYCDICEAFGHWTDNCDDEQTF